VKRIALKMTEPLMPWLEAVEKIYISYGVLYNWEFRGAPMRKWYELSREEKDSICRGCMRIMAIEMSLLVLEKEQWRD
jgi:hypothetical protein